MMIFKQLLPGVFLTLLSHMVVASEIEATLGWADIYYLGFPVSGVIEKVHANSGAVVSQSQTLVQLEQQPFQLLVKKHQAKVDTISPLLFDAKLELNHAEELFERTVLSEVELQKVEAKYKGLEAQEQVATMDLELAKWSKRQSVINAPFDGIVIASNMAPGQVISEYNSANIVLQIARKGMMSATLLVNDVNDAQLSQSVKVKVGTQDYTGKIHSIKFLQKTNQFQLEVIFEHANDVQYWPGQKASVIF